MREHLLIIFTLLGLIAFIIACSSLISDDPIPPHAARAGVKYMGSVSPDYVRE